MSDIKQEIYDILNDLEFKLGLDDRHNDVKKTDATNAILALTEDRIEYFKYTDWETGDDDVLRVDDWVYVSRQDHNGQDVHHFTAKIVRHHDNGLPMLLTNIDPEDPDNSGDYHSIEQSWLDGFEFTRIEDGANGGFHGDT